MTEDAVAIWKELVASLHTRTDALVDDFIARLDSSATYPTGLVPVTDVRQMAYETMAMLIHRLRGDGLPAELVSLPGRLGARRARQGVQRDDLSKAIFINFKVLWASLQQVALTDAERYALFSHVELVLDTIEDYSVRAQDAFLKEEARLTRNSALLRERMLNRLFGPETPTDKEVDEVSRILDLPTDGVYELVAVTGASAVRLKRKYSVDQSVFFYDLPRALVAFRLQPRFSKWRNTLIEVDGGYHDYIRGLTQVPSAARTAQLISEYRSRSGLSTLDDVWASLARAQLDRLVPSFGASIRERFRKCSAEERDRLLEILRIYSETGSIKISAERLYCHRNTIVNRLKQFKEVTGIDLTVPQEAALAIVALSAEEGTFVLPQLHRANQSMPSKPLLRA